MKTYGDFPTMEEIKRDYNELMEIIKGVRTIEQAREIERYVCEVEINGDLIDEFVRNGGTNKDIEWIRCAEYGCLDYIYSYLDGKIIFDVYSKYCDYDFIHDVTIDELTEELYEKAKAEVLEM